LFSVSLAEASSAAFSAERHGKMMCTIAAVVKLTPDKNACNAKPNANAENLI
jgi:hypothetical protein